MYRDSEVIKKPLLQYSENEERATLIDDGDGYLPMAPRKKNLERKRVQKREKEGNPSHQGKNFNQSSGLFWRTKVFCL